MLLFRLYLLSISFLALSGCVTPPTPTKTYQVNIDISHAKTTEGHINSSSENIGVLYLYNTQSNRLSELAHIDLKSKKDVSHFSSKRAKKLSGIGIAGNIDKGVSLAILGKIQNEFYIDLKEYLRTKYSNTFSDLAQNIRDRVALGEDIHESWSLKDAAKPHSPLRHVLAYSTIMAKSAKFMHKDNKELTSALKLQDDNGSTVSISYHDIQNSFEEFNGTSSPVLLRYHVIKTSLQVNEEGEATYHFKTDQEYNQTKFIQALRTL